MSWELRKGILWIICFEKIFGLLAYDSTLRLRRTGCQIPSLLDLCHPCFDSTHLTVGLFFSLSHPTASPPTSCSHPLSHIQGYTSCAIVLQQILPSLPSPTPLLRAYLSVLKFFWQNQLRATIDYWDFKSRRRYVVFRMEDWFANFYSSS